PGDLPRGWRGRWARRPCLPGGHRGPRGDRAYGDPGPDRPVVRRGDVVFVPAMPARLAIAPEVVVGAALSGGEPVVQVLPKVPTFTIVLPEGQGRLVEPGMLVEITSGGAQSWSAQVTVVRRDEARGLVAELDGIDGEPICADGCAAIPI